MQADSGADPDSKELLTNIKRLTRIVLDKLEEGSKKDHSILHRPDSMVASLQDPSVYGWKREIQEQEDESEGIFTTK
jgi:hypothetical protein